MKQIECKALAIGYDNSILADGINFSINKGDYVCIIGENGAGKTTLMKVLLNLNKPMSGDIILGEELNRKDFGYLTQQKEIQKDFPGSVKEIVISGCQSKCGIRPFYNKSEKQLAVDAMDKMKILDLANKCFRELSGGQQQRVLMARALCATSKILFLDEPVTGLDPNAITEFYNIINTLNKENQVTIVMISHDIKTSMKHASHILHVGKQTFFGTKEEYLKGKSGNVFDIPNGEADKDANR